MPWNSGNTRSPSPFLYSESILYYYVLAAINTKPYLDQNVNMNVAEPKYAFLLLLQFITPHQ